MLNRSKAMQKSAKLYYKDRPVEFIEDWTVTADPRNQGTNIPTLMPFCLFERQKDLIHFLHDCVTNKNCGAIEKCRDAGATWVCCAFSVWLWLFYEGSSVGWGSRKEMLVDQLGDMDSIFEKMRTIIKNLPSFFKPKGFNDREHSRMMRIYNPDNSASITGEAGDAIGRGGRKSIYFKDESAHYERPEKIEAALGDNTNVQIDISSVNGPTTIFQRRVDAGDKWEEGKKMDTNKTWVFVFDWRDHPFKTQEWYDRRRAKAEEEGLLHLFAQEVDRDASSAVEGTVIPMAWIKSAVDAHKTLNIESYGKTFCGFDVSEGIGRDKHATAIRQSFLLKDCIGWANGDPIEATQKSLHMCKRRCVDSLQYDSVGVGSNVKSEINRLDRERLLDTDLEIVPWCGKNSPLFPKARVIKGDKESPKNMDFYANLKAQGWWQLRTRFKRTFDAVTKGTPFNEEELISISSEIEDLQDLLKELSQPTYKLNEKDRIIVNKTPEGSKSPNRADSIVMAFWPKHKKKVLI